MDPVDKVYMITGGVADGNVLDLANFPHAATALQRVAGIFLDYHKLLDYGLTGLYQLINEKQAEHPENDPNFYEGMRMALKTVMKTLEWYADQAAGLYAAEADEQRKKDLKEMERICRKLVKEKPESFREAIQLVIIYSLIDGAREWGRMDDYLALYYTNDLKNGILDEEEAIRLLTSFWQLMIVKEQVTDDRVIIGGLGRKYPKEADELAMVIMEVSRRVRDIVPQLTLRMYEGMNSKLYEKAMDVIGEGVTYPMLYQDENIIPGVMKVFGISYEEAQGGMEPGKSVAILGSGPIGLSVLLAAKAYGASDIFMTDMVENRLAKAKEMGATRVINIKEEDYTEVIKRETNQRGVDIVIDTTGHESTYRTFHKAAIRGGSIVLVGIGPGEYYDINLAYIRDNEMKLVGIFRFANTSRRMIDLIRTGRVDISKLVSHHMPLEKVNEAFELVRSKADGVIKVVVDMD